MSSVRKLARLESEDRRLLLGAGLILTLIRLGLWILPWRLVVAAVGVIPMPWRGTVAPSRAAWAIRSGSRVVPGATCLTQSLALHYLLNRSGHESRLFLGVAKGTSGFEAHAWVEHNGEPLLDEPDEVARYSRLLTMERI